MDRLGRLVMGVSVFGLAAAAAASASCGSSFQSGTGGSSSSTERASVTTGTEAGGGSASSVSATTTSTSTSTGGEDCYNGTDDDADGKIDCADPDCMGKVSCIPLKVMGEVVVLISDKGKPCPKGWGSQRQVIDVGDPQPATCGCDCNHAKGACTATFDFYTDPACTANPGQKQVADDGSCVKVGGAPLTSSAKVLSIDPNNGGACPPSPSMTAPPFGKTTAQLCEMPTPKGCDSDQLCLPAFDPANHQACIIIKGDKPCGGQATKHLIFDANVVDGRACTACTCSLPMLVTCDGASSLDLDSDDNCGVNVATATDLTCNGYVATQIKSYKFTGATKGTCTPSAVSPTGAVTGDNPYTLCCQ